ncbi:MAG: histidine kinase [Candidatus Eremiobacteraeota bacterium]|nr:histidine kinase [Candidatus Eremiobacteraeota bacterium]MBV8434007.1 histidine kinase [Candidatus Eremiobacteraeota bacterium]MBV8722827.1 histidine kinase [Candidatus Eremiobacteraeota bacterium]
MSAKWRGRFMAAAALLGIFCLIFVFDFEYRYLDDLARGHQGTFSQRFLEEATGVFSFFILLPFVFWMTRRFPITRSNWYVTVPIAFAGAVLMSAAHTTLMAMSREILAPMLGLGPYHYGIMAYRYPMEASNDVISYAFTAALIYGWDHMQAARRAELAAAELHGKLAEAELENLRLQLNPHFLFNTLNAISAVMYEDVRKADDMIAKLSDFLRLVLESDGVHEVPLQDEMTVERKYVEIMTARLEQRLDLHVSVDATVRDALVPFMILQPLLENSIRHGMPPGRGAIAISVEAARHNGSVVISVADDGTGYAPDATPGRGLSIVRARLGHMYGSHASFSIESRTPGTLAVVTLPFSGKDTG